MHKASERALVFFAFATAMAFLATLFGFVRPAAAQTPPSWKQITWSSANSPLRLKRYECADEGANMVLVQGVVELIHPDDSPDPLSAPPLMDIRCEHFIFEKGSRLVLRAELFLRAQGSIAGAVTIENVRGTQGVDAKPDPATFDIRKERTGATPPKQGKGDNSQDTSMKYPLGRNADTGPVGYTGEGGRVLDGGGGVEAERSGQKARPGGSAANVKVRAGTYAPLTVVHIIAKGGNGGNGGKGGRGVDGGDGGRGGEGGDGGNAAGTRSAANGGQGGRGGDGGNGGDGGRGGNGGNGGDGGDGFVDIIVNPSKPGNPPMDFIDELTRGFGGKPGDGGDPGIRGKGGKGGPGGCGGNGFLWNGGGRCAGEGPPGDDGRDGRPGLLGEYGKDGVNGRRGTGEIRNVTEVLK